MTHTSLEAIAEPADVLKAVGQRRGEYWRILDEMVKAANGTADIAQARAKALAQGVAEFPDPRDGGQKIKRNTLTHAMDLAYSKGQLSPDEWAAGTRFRDLWELSRISPARSLDLERILASTPPEKARTVKIRGQGDTARAVLADDKRERAQRWRPVAGKMKMAWADIRPSILDAQHELGRLHALLGAELYAVVVQFAAEGQTLNAIARSHKRSRSRKTISKRMHEGLAILAEHYGYGTPSPAHPRRVAPMRAEA